MDVELKTEQHVGLFELPSYGGVAKTLYGMSYPRLSTFFPNDTLSSIKIPFGTEVHLYENENFGGKRVIIDKDTTFIGADINNRISSMRIYKSPIAYSDPNFTGRSQVLDFLEGYDIQPQGRSRFLRIGDNSIRSLKIPYPWGVKAYPDTNFRGGYEFYRHDIENITTGISSLTVVPVILSL